MRDYDKFSETFSNSRKNMKWPEIDELFEFLNKHKAFSDKIKLWNTSLIKKIKILDIWCWSWRLLSYIQNYLKDFIYLWIDSSKWMIEEATKAYKWYEFKVRDMIDIDKIDNKYDIIFFIASYHHLDSDILRKRTLEKLRSISQPWAIVLMTNWNLFSEKNYNCGTCGN